LAPPACVGQITIRAPTNGADTNANLIKPAHQSAKEFNETVCLPSAYLSPAKLADTRDRDQRHRHRAANDTGEQRPARNRKDIPLGTPTRSDKNEIF
jgi:hypothetical protein